MKSSKKTLHELSPHIPQNTSKRNISRSTNEMLHACGHNCQNAMNEMMKHPC
jgi:hypothetical protein